jgi:hypothetical protein
MHLNLYITLQGWTDYLTGWRTFMCELYPHIVCVCARACACVRQYTSNSYTGQFYRWRDLQICRRGLLLYCVTEILKEILTVVSWTVICVSRLMQLVVKDKWIYVTRSISILSYTVYYNTSSCCRNSCNFIPFLSVKVWRDSYSGLQSALNRCTE